jgi:hypothetical protein
MGWHSDDSDPGNTRIEPYPGLPPLYRTPDMFNAQGQQVALPYDPERPTFLHVDFSNVGLGAVLSQTNSAGHEYMVACCSRSLNKQERNYDTYKGECLAAVWGYRIYRHLLHDRQFTLVTGDKPNF